jgi:membrane-associated protease RseP (regulator of RpoE activity)
MRTPILTIVATVPLLLGVSNAAQKWSTEAPTAHPWIFSSDEGGSSSYLGVDIADVTTERLSALKLKEEKGVEVTMVDQDAPAGKAGIKEHDVILTMNGTGVESGAQLRRMIHETPSGRTVTLGISRDGSPMTIKVQLADKHKEFNFTAPKANSYSFEMPEIHIPEMEMPAINMVIVTQSARSGLMVENLTPQLGDFFGVKDGNGVLVRSVDKGSRAEKAGFRAGDVITKVNDQPIHDTSDFSHAVKERKGAAVNIGVIRDRKSQNINLPLPEKKESSNWWQEESLDQPLIKAESALALARAEDQLARLRPQAVIAWDSAAENSRKASDYLQKALAEEQKTLCKQTEKQREELRKDQRKLREEMDRLRLELKQDFDL